MFRKRVWCADPEKGFEDSGDPFVADACRKSEQCPDNEFARNSLPIVINLVGIRLRLELTFPAPESAQGLIVIASC